jgi:hypothetical protein
MAAPATSWGFKRGRPQSFIARDHRMHKGNRDAKGSCHRRRRSWINQRRIHHRPLLVPPDIDRGTSFPFDFINREVGRSAGDLSHHLLLIQRWSAAPIFYLRMQLRMTCLSTSSCWSFCSGWRSSRMGCGNEVGRRDTARRGCQSRGSRSAPKSRSPVPG